MQPFTHFTVAHIGASVASESSIGQPIQFVTDVRRSMWFGCIKSEFLQVLCYRFAWYSEYLRTWLNPNWQLIKHDFAIVRKFWTKKKITNSCVIIVNQVKPIVWVNLNMDYSALQYNSMLETLIWVHVFNRNWLNATVLPDWFSHHSSTRSLCTF